MLSIDKIRGKLVRTDGGGGAATRKQRFTGLILGRGEEWDGEMIACLYRTPILLYTTPILSFARVGHDKAFLVVFCGKQSDHEKEPTWGWVSPDIVHTLADSKRHASFTEGTALKDHGKTKKPVFVWSPCGSGSTVQG